jgi:LAS superfamily LD-carboxypeptidase LdcB
LDPYFDLVEAAAKEGIKIAINSGFRSYPEQKVLYEGFIKKLPHFNRAAKPGFSKHQNGIAFDIDVAGGSGNPVYDWLKKNAPSRGFVRTVSGEPWHWENDKKKAAAAVAAHTFKTGNVKD